MLARSLFPDSKPKNYQRTTVTTGAGMTSTMTTTTMTSDRRVSTSPEALEMTGMGRPAAAAAGRGATGGWPLSERTGSLSTTLKGRGCFRRAVAWRRSKSSEKRGWDIIGRLVFSFAAYLTGVESAAGTVWEESIHVRGWNTATQLIAMDSPPCFFNPEVARPRIWRVEHRPSRGLMVVGAQIDNPFFLFPTAPASIHRCSTK